MHRFRSLLARRGCRLVGRMIRKPNHSHRSRAFGNGPSRLEKIFESGRGLNGNSGAQALSAAPSSEAFLNDLHAGLKDSRPRRGRKRGRREPSWVSRMSRRYRSPFDPMQEYSRAVDSLSRAVSVYNTDKNTLNEEMQRNVQCMMAMYEHCRRDSKFDIGDFQHVDRALFGSDGSNWSVADRDWVLRVHKWSVPVLWLALAPYSRWGDNGLTHADVCPDRIWRLFRWLVEKKGANPFDAQFLEWNLPMYASSIPLELSDGTIHSFVPPLFLLMLELKNEVAPMFEQETNGEPRINATTLCLASDDLEGFRFLDALFIGIPESASAYNAVIDGLHIRKNAAFSARCFKFLRSQSGSEQLRMLHLMRAIRLVNVENQKDLSIFDQIHDQVRLSNLIYMRPFRKSPFIAPIQYAEDGYPRILRSLVVDAMERHTFGAVDNPLDQFLSVGELFHACLHWKRDSPGPAFVAEQTMPMLLQRPLDIGDSAFDISKLSDGQGVDINKEGTVLSWVNDLPHVQWDSQLVEKAVRTMLAAILADNRDLVEEIFYALNDLSDSFAPIRGRRGKNLLYHMRQHSCVPNVSVQLFGWLNSLRMDTARWENMLDSFGCMVYEKPITRYQYLNASLFDYLVMCSVPQSAMLAACGMDTTPTCTVIPSQPPKDAVTDSIALFPVARLESFLRGHEDLPFSLLAGIRLRRFYSFLERLSNVDLLVLSGQHEKYRLLVEDFLAKEAVCDPDDISSSLLNAKKCLMHPALLPYALLGFDRERIAPTVEAVLETQPSDEDWVGSSFRLAYKPTWEAKGDRLKYFSRHVTLAFITAYRGLGADVWQLLGDRITDLQRSDQFIEIDKPGTYVALSQDPKDLHERDNRMLYSLDPLDLARKSSDDYVMSPGIDGSEEQRAVWWNLLESSFDLTPLDQYCAENELDFACTPSTDMSGILPTSLSIDIGIKSRNGGTWYPMNYACVSGNLRAVHVLCELSELDYRVTRPASGEWISREFSAHNPMFSAVASDRTDVFRYLMHRYVWQKEGQLGNDPSAPVILDDFYASRGGYNALELACIKKNPDIVDELLRVKSALHLEDFVRDEKVMKLAATADSGRIVHSLLTTGACDPNVPFFQSDTKSEFRRARGRALFRAGSGPGRRNAPAGARFLDGGFETPLLRASRSGDAESVRSLLRYGADPLTVTSDGADVFWMAKTAARPQVVKVLKEEGLTDPGNCEWPLHVREKFSDL